MTSESQIASFIVVTYNSAQVIRGCLTPLVDLVRAGHEVVIVDNNSADLTLDICRELIPEAVIAENGDNQGFAKATNFGVSLSKGSTIILLNPDAVGTRAAFEELMKSSAENPGAVVAPMIVHPGQRLDIVSAGRTPTLLRMFLHYTGLARSARRTAWEGHYLFPWQASTDRDVDWATGACLAIPRSIWDRVGGLTERWFMYAEDVEFCHRVTRAGYKVRLVPGIRIGHETGTGTAEPRSMRADWIVNLWHFYNEDLSPNRIASSGWKLVVAAGLGSRAVAYFIKSLKSHDQAAWRHESRRFRAFGAALLKAK